jgi:hypothetical protein
MVAVPDERLEKIAEIVKPEKVTPTIIEFVDIAGLVKGAHKGEGLGNQFLAQIRECDAILEIVRCFRANEIEHIEKEVNPERDIEIIKLELIMKDLETIEKISEKTEREAKSGDKESIKKFDLLNKIKGNLFEGKAIFESNLTDEEKFLLKEFQFLTAKPIVFIFNSGEEEISPELIKKYQGIPLNLKLEEEISELSESETKELGMESKVDQLILACYNILDLITFYTIAGGKETRAWTIKRGILAPAAGGKVHTDFEEKFIRAEVIPWQKLVAAGSWTKARELGQIQTVGKDYVVQDGDVIEFKI